MASDSLRPSSLQGFRVVRLFSFLCIPCPHMTTQFWTACVVFGSLLWSEIRWWAAKGKVKLLSSIANEHLCFPPPPPRSSSPPLHMRLNSVRDSFLPLVMNCHNNVSHTVEPRRHELPPTIIILMQVLCVFLLVCICIKLVAGSFVSALLIHIALSCGFPIRFLNVQR